MGAFRSKHCGSCENQTGGDVIAVGAKGTVCAVVQIHSSLWISRRLLVSHIGQMRKAPRGHLSATQVATGHLHFTSL